MRAKIAVSILLSLSLLFGVCPGALAAPDNDGIVIRKGETSDNVILLQLRLRDLGYYDYKTTGYFGEFTFDALKDFQSNNKLTADGVAGQKTLDLMYSNDAIRKPVEPIDKPAASTNTVTTSRVKYGQLKDWDKWVRARFSNKTMLKKAKVIDFNTGKSYTVVVVGGHNHADVEPATQKDCDIFKSTYGGSWSWDRRAVIVNIDGIWVAGSTNGMPHGYETVKNNGMNGQVCIHFLNSRNHIHNMRDPTHQYQVMRAAGKKK